MTYREPLSQAAIALSISESADLPQLGLAEEHLRDAMVEVARHLLALGARLVYGGDLRAFGFTELLLELVTKYRRDADVGDDRVAVQSYLSWPVHSLLPANEIQQLAKELVGIAELHCLDLKGREIPLARLASPARKPTELEWTEGLSSMRRVVTQVSDARILLGGRTTGFKGSMPGIAEEAVSSIKARRPLYVLGGFGGCAREIAESIGLMAPRESPTLWPGRDQLVDLSVSDLRNGLSSSENCTLARTPHIDEAIALVLRGLLNTVSATS